jgi:hypothetical protein
MDNAGVLLSRVRDPRCPYNPFVPERGRDSRRQAQVKIAATLSATELTTTACVEIVYLYLHSRAAVVAFGTHPAGKYRRTVVYL